jgi:hypothetical protein
MKSLYLINIKLPYTPQWFRSPFLSDNPLTIYNFLPYWLKREVEL